MEGWRLVFIVFMACSVKKEVRVRIQVVSACTFSTRLDEKLWEHVTLKKINVKVVTMTYQL